MVMKLVREKALKMRLKGFSYNEINRALGVPKSTQNGWFRHLVLSDAAVTRLKERTLQGTINAFVKRNKLQTHHAKIRARKAQAFGRKEIPFLTKKDLKIVGATLYWAEGYKRLRIRDGKERVSHPIALVNSDPEMIRVFIRFLREVMEVDFEKITASMRLYPHINEEAAHKYWVKITGLPRQQFRKSTYLISSASKGVRPYNRLPWGTLSIQVFDTQKFHRLLGFIEGVKIGS